MTQLRKEPTFGEPSQPELEQAQTQTPEVQKPFSFSVRSTQSPGHTFTPVMKRPIEVTKETGDFATLEEKAMLKAEAEQTSVQQGKTVKTTQFAFTPVTQEKAEQEPVQAVAAPKPLSAGEPVAPVAKVVNESVNNAPKETSSVNNVERVVPVQAQAAAKASVAEKVPSKYRRLILVALLALALLLVFFLLKPKTPETVEALQNQGTSLPIEFRPVDEAEAKRAEEEAKALLQQQAEQLAAQQAAQQQAEQTAQNNAQPVVQNTVANVVEQPVAAVTPAQPEPKAEPAPKPEPVVVKPVVAEPVKKPVTNGSVIYQPENKPEPVKVEKVKPVVAKPESAKVAQPTPAAVKVKAEPAKVAEPVKAAAAVSSKTLTVQKGVTLFQNFRDNGLGNNLPELNKMTKLNGETSRLNPGQKITVRLDNQNRIVEMNIGSGRYIRQADGSYIYK